MEDDGVYTKYLFGHSRIDKYYIMLFSNISYENNKAKKQDIYMVHRYLHNQCVKYIL